MRQGERGIKRLTDGRYRATVWHSGHNIRRIFPNKTQARIWREQTRATIRMGTFERKPQRVSFRNAVKEFLKWSKTNVRPKTHKIDQWASRQWLDFQGFAGKNLDQITLLDVEAFKRRVLGTAAQNHSKAEGPRQVSKRTVDISLGRLRRMLRLYVHEWKIYRDLPAMGLKLFNEDTQRQRFLTEEEEQSLLGACRPDLRRVVLFALHTGMRRGEIMNLRWTDVDAQNGVVTIPAARAKGRHDRFVMLNSVALSILEELPRPIDRKKLVFGNSKGNVDGNLGRRWTKALEKAGIEDFRFHDLRHTFATRLAMTGHVQQRDLQELLGHTSNRMTDRYVHLLQKHLKEAVALLEPDQQKTNIVSDPAPAMGVVRSA